MPAQQPPPSYLPLSPRALRLTWGAPDNPNGLIHSYTVYRDGQVIAVLPYPGEVE